MKKKFCIILISIISVLCFAFGLCACTAKVEFKVNFVVDGQTVYTVNTNGNEALAMPADPQKEDYIFDGWYWDNDVWEKPFTANSLLNASLSSNMSVYCKWTPAHEHAYIEKVIEDKYKASDASCIQKAVYYYSCACGEKGTKTFEYGELLQHTPKEATRENEVDSTCTNEGHYDETIRCKDCNAVISTTPHTIEKKTHTPKEPTHENVIDSTCSQEGSYDEVVRCKDCNAVISTTPFTIEKKTHTPKEPTHENVIDSTCTNEGHYDEVIRCNVCNTVIASVLKTVEKKPHTWSDWAEKDSESHKRTCAVCKTEQTQRHELGGKNGDVCTKCIYTYAPATIKSLAGAIINQVDKTVKLTVDKTTTRLLLSNMVTVSSHSTWKVYDDSVTEVVKTIPLVDGYNTFYITVTDTQDSSIENTYTFTVYKSFEVALNYYGVYSDIIHTETIVTGYEFTVNYTPEITGYTFNYWKLNEERAVKFIPFADVKLYADCTANTYRITFITDEKAQAVEAVTAIYDGQTTLPSSSKTGYTFDGWLYGDEEVTSGTWKIAADCTLKAKWQANTDTLYTVKHIGQNITGDEFDVELDTQKLRGTSDSKVTPAVMSFTGFTAPQAEEVTVAPDGSAILTYYYLRNDYQLTLINNDGTTSAHSLKYEASIPAAERQGYTFGGWFTDVELTQSVHSMPADELTVYAWWQEENKANDFYYLGYSAIEIKGYTGTSSDVTIPAYIGGAAVTGIDNYAFYRCERLASITLPDGMTGIGDAFDNCYNLTRITLPDSVTFINNSAFDECNSISSIYYMGDIASWCSIRGRQHLMSCGASGRKLFINGQEITGELIIPDGVTSIGDYAFRDCNGLTGVTIPYGVTGIGEWAFSYCDTITKITIPDTLTNIGNNAFAGTDYKITSIFYTGNIASWCGINGLGYLTDNASGRKLFIAGQEITGELIISDGVTSIGNGAFWGCNSLTSITIPDSVTSIGICAFSDCTSLTDIIIPNSVTSIGESAFNSCYKLVSVTLPVGITSIDDRTFYDCRKLSSITIPDSVTRIGSYAFGDCSSLKSITVPDSVKSIGTEAFKECTLEYVFYGGTALDWNEISIYGSEILKYARRYYYSETQPMEEGLYWHYADDGKTPVKW